jgi:hypothetical protein
VPVSAVGGIRRGSVHADVVGGLTWATASFVPAAVRAAWGLATPAACGSAAKAVPKVTPHAETGTNSSITTVALSQVGRGDTPGRVNESSARIFGSGNGSIIPSWNW